jgi:hypothetical protein
MTKWHRAPAPCTSQFVMTDEAHPLLHCQQICSQPSNVQTPSEPAIHSLLVLNLVYGAPLGLLGTPANYQIHGDNCQGWVPRDHVPIAGFQP